MKEFHINAIKRSRDARRADEPGRTAQAGAVPPDRRRDRCAAGVVAGQVARTAYGEPVGGGDLAAQVERAYLNVATAVAAAGGSFADVAKLTVYVVDWTPQRMADLGAGVGRAAARLGADLVKPMTLIGVATLAEPDLLVEVEAVAILP